MSGEIELNKEIYDDENAKLTSFGVNNFEGSSKIKNQHLQKETKRLS